jgi:hypothetical protein
MIGPFEEWLKLQLQLQVYTYQQDPRELEGKDCTDFLMWNAFAATDELHEAMQEIGWKPWASSRHVNSELFLEEVVDALHFIGNMVLAAAMDRRETPEQLAKILWVMYTKKLKINADRQVQGYDGLKGKCPTCRRVLFGSPQRCVEHGMVDASF